MDPKRTALRVASAVGQGQRACRVADLLNIAELDVPHVDQNVQRTTITQEEKRGEVLIPLVQGQNSLISYRYCILAHAFRLRGYEPIIPLCYRELDVCMQKSFGKDEDSTCDHCNYYGKKLLKRFGLEYSGLGSLHNGESPDVRNAELDTTSQTHEYRGIDVAKYAAASTRKFLKKYHVDFDDEYEKNVFVRFLNAGRTLVDVAEHILRTRDVDAVVAHDAVYIYGGLFLAVAEKHDVIARSLSIGYNDKKIMIGDQRNISPYGYYTDHDFAKCFVRNPLSEEQREEIETLMANRKEGINVGVYHATYSSERFIDDEDSTIIGLFTNLLWDASLEAEGRGAFLDPFSWLRTTLEHVCGCKDVQLVIKTHPAEKIRGTNEQMSDWLEDTYRRIPENVHILSPDTEVDPYKFLKDIDIGVVWNSMLGLEMAFEGTPTIVAGETHYRDLGFTFDADDRDEYLKLLDADLEMDSEMQNRARRYAYLFFIRRQIDFPFYTESNDGIELLPVAQEDLTRGNENIDAIIDGILSDKVVTTDG